VRTKQSSYRISDEGRQIIKTLAKKYGITDTAILEIAIRKLGEVEGVKLDQTTETCNTSNGDRSNS